MNTFTKVILLTIALCLTLIAVTYSEQAEASWAAHEDTFVEAARLTGVDVRDLAAMAALESSFRSSVSAKGTSATGLFQFTSRTWRVTLGNYGSQYGLTRRVGRTDAWANTLMGAEYLKENYRVLLKKMDREPTLIDLYMAHFIAPRRVAALESVDHDLAIADIYPRLARYNTSIFYKDGKSRTVNEFKDYINDKVLRAYGKYSDRALTAYNSHMDAFLTEYADAAIEYWVCAADEELRKWGPDFVEQVLAKVNIPLTIADLPMTDDLLINGHKHHGGQSYKTVTPLTDRRWLV